jgi:hypothetical protein
MNRGDDYTIRDISGMSNLTYFVESPTQKIVIRFFISDTGNTELENKVYQISS